MSTTIKKPTIIAFFSKFLTIFAIICIAVTLFPDKTAYAFTGVCTGRSSPGRLHTMTVNDETSPWKCTFSDTPPAQHWSSITLDDSSWRSAPGTGSTLHLAGHDSVLSEGFEGHIYLRKIFLNPFSAIGKVTLTVFKPIIFSAYLNGQKCFSFPNNSLNKSIGHTDNYDRFSVDLSNCKQYLRPGRNVFALQLPMNRPEVKPPPSIPILSIKGTLKPCIARLQLFVLLLASYRSDQPLR